ncbi:hypothetical protein [Halosimplex amylolyticum]|uniref:hypothetical protein n=1 Tax=Halosimplex amylolyticum TaxID=3396616 RepID=UPI003F57A3AC
MTTIEFGTKTAADAIRDEYADHLCSDDDRRLKEVVFASDTPDHVIDQAHQQALDSRSEREGGSGQVPLSDHERGEIDFSEGRASVPHARSVKGIAADEGVSDWLAHYDPTLTVDEHREVMERAGREGGGRRREDSETATEKAGRAARRSQDEGCDHARGHCENGDPEACEFLTDACGYAKDEVSHLLDETGEETTTEQQELVRVGGGDFPEMEVSPSTAGALSRSWQGYRGAVSRLGTELADVREAVINARQAMQVINAIRERNGQDPLHPDRLHDLLEALGDMPAKIPEVRSLAHYQDLAQPDREAVIETDDQRTLSGEQADPQARLAGGEQGERGQGEVEEHVEENPGGVLADQRESTDTGSTGEGTEQQIPDEFAVAEGGQETL